MEKIQKEHTFSNIRFVKHTTLKKGDLVSISNHNDVIFCYAYLIEDPIKIDGLYKAEVMIQTSNKKIWMTLTNAIKKIPE